MKGEQYILKFQDMDCWIADWDGDPGRTLVREDAKRYPTGVKAMSEAIKIVEKNCHRKFTLVVEKL